MLKYSTTIRYSDEDRAFIAEVPALPGCAADGPTPARALAAVEEVAMLWLEAAKDEGRSIPPPDTRKRYGGKLLVRMPEWLHRELDEEAAREGVSTNHHVVALLAARGSTVRLLRVLTDEFLGHTKAGRSNLPISRLVAWADRVAERAEYLPQPRRRSARGRGTGGPR
jgi:predicted RNase H-like HicB family nuclease